MSYPKKSLPSKKSANTVSNPKLTQEKREKLVAIQQREQLKGLLVNKFLEKYGSIKGVSQDALNREISNFVTSQPLTADNLRKLEEKIRAGDIGKANAASANPNPSSTGNLPPAEKTVSINDTANQFTLKGVQSTGNLRRPQDDEISVTSSQRPKSIYQLGDEDDEWATMMKYDAELHKKEKEIDVARTMEQRKRMKEELDRQLEVKNRMKEYEKREWSQYVDVVGQQLNQYDEKEKKKNDDMHNKIMQEKYSRDKQLHEEYLRKKLEKKTEKELDTILVKKIQNEIEAEIRAAADKKKEQKQLLKQVLLDNEERRIRLQAEAQRQKEEDTRAQQEYTRLIEKQEAARAAEIKAREDRAKQFMNLMADTIIKDQKAQMLEEERKLLQQTLDKEAREIEDEKMRQRRQFEQKKEIKRFLDSQLAAKEIRKKEEQEVEKIQADIWKKDTEEFRQWEKNKADKVKTAHIQQAEFLKKQMELESVSKAKKMSAHELLMNKQKLKEIAVKTDSTNFQKSEVVLKK